MPQPFETTPAGKMYDAFFQYVIAPLRRLAQSMMFRLVLVFCATFIAAGYLVYFFETPKGNVEQFPHFWDGIWFGIVTITTTGYGDKIPMTLGGRVVAGLVMCIGIITAGIVTGNIASWLVERQLKLGRGIANLAHKSGHLVICGWRREMNRVLDEIFRLNPDLKTEDVVVVAPIPQETLETFKTNDKFAEVHVLRGEYFSQSMLERAGVKNAKKVLILADWSGQKQSFTEIDAKTVLTAMTIDKIAPTVRVAAELLDLKFENYLKMAHVDEIIYSREYARILLANCVKSPGLSHVILDLLDVDTESRIRSVFIPPEYNGKSFADVAAYCRKLNRSIAVGVIENTGKIKEIKKEALREVQKNPNTRTILGNLKEIRHLGSNVPVLNPKKDYVIKPHSLAVVIENPALTRPRPDQARRSDDTADRQTMPVGVGV